MVGHWTERGDGGISDFFSFMGCLGTLLFSFPLCSFLCCITFFAHRHLLFGLSLFSLISMEWSYVSLSPSKSLLTR